MAESGFLSSACLSVLKLLHLNGSGTEWNGTRRRRTHGTHTGHRHTQAQTLTRTSQLRLLGKWTWSCSRPPSFQNDGITPPMLPSLCPETGAAILWAAQSYPCPSFGVAGRHTHTHTQKFARNTRAHTPTLGSCAHARAHADAHTYTLVRTHTQTTVVTQVSV